MTRIAITGGATVGNGRRAATQYGRRLDETAATGEWQISQDVYKQALPVTFAEVNGGHNLSGALDELFTKVPAGARIIEATVKVTTAFAGGTSIAVGLHEPDGTVVDADGLVTAAQGAVANLTLNEHIVGTGALVNLTTGTGLAADAIVSITTVGTFTVGELVITVEYTKPNQHAQLMNG